MDSVGGPSARHFARSSANRGHSAIGGICVSVPLVPKKGGAAVAPEAPPKREVTRRQMVGIVITIVLAVITYQTLLKLSGGSDIQPTNLSEISPPELENARRLWTEKGPLNYNMELVFVSPSSKTDMLLEVRGGVARKLVKNGTPVTREDDLAHWTVEGQFEQLAKYIQLDNSDYAKNRGSSMINVGKFDEKLGYPADYSRQGNGDQVKYHITVTKFEEVKE
jgi:hypothetical protein